MVKSFTIDLIPLRTVPGFRWSGIYAGLKHSGAKDLALAVAERPAQAAGCFTTHAFPGAPIIVAREHLRTKNLKGIIVNSGHANAFTGQQGIDITRSICSATAQALGLGPAAAKLFLPASTGIIGSPPPLATITAALPQLVAKLAATPRTMQAFADAILTTDKTAKLITLEIRVKAPTRSRKYVYTLCAIAKGAGMIEPNMATMLCYLFSDFHATAAVHRRVLKNALSTTLNAISIDAETSTSDMTVSLMSGAAAQPPVPEEVLTAAFTYALSAIAEQILKDGEGATRILRLAISQAPSQQLAEQLARSVASSILVKTALYGKDPNWGRIVMALGKLGTNNASLRTILNVNKLELCFYDNPPTFMLPAHLSSVQSNTAAAVTISAETYPNTAETQVLKKLFARKVVYCECKLHAGKHRKLFALTDLSEAYVRFNSMYST